MFDFLFEGRLIGYVLAAIPAVILLALWLRDRKKGWLYALVPVLALVGVYWVLDRLVETRREQVERKLNEMAAAVKKKDTAALFNHISDQFRLGSVDKANFKKAVEAIQRRGWVDELTLWDYDFSDGQGKVTFKAKPRGSVAGDAFFLIRGEFVLDADKQWRLKTFKASNPYSDSKSDLDFTPYLGGD